MHLVTSSCYIMILTNRNLCSGQKWFFKVCSLHHLPEHLISQVSQKECLPHEVGDPELVHLQLYFRSVMFKAQIR